jgi:hypothetical protein
MWSEILEPLFVLARVIFWSMLGALAVSVPLAIWKVFDLLGW